jgi:hypothetical protein
MKVSLIVVLAAVLGAAAAADEQGTHGPPPAQDPRFEFLKGLAGTWVGASVEEGMPPSTVEFRVTAGGHAVEEREFLGTPMEMVTLYHMEGGDLVATHYCMIGNRPRLEAAPEVVDGTLAFACDGKPGGAASHDDEHVHAWSMRLEPDGRLSYSAELVQGGRVTGAPAIVLTRQRETAAR